MSRSDFEASSSRQLVSAISTNFFDYYLYIILEKQHVTLCAIWRSTNRGNALKAKHAHAYEQEIESERIPKLSINDIRSL